MADESMSLAALQSVNLDQEFHENDSASAQIAIEGDIHVPLKSPADEDELSTLDEPVSETLVSTLQSLLI